MPLFEDFEQALREALTHLYDPIYRPPALLRLVIGRALPGADASMQSLIVAAIASLKPAANVPPGARLYRLYELLSSRYVHELTQEETAERLGITARHLRREQQRAVHLLAQHLWERSRIDNDPLAISAIPATSPPVPTATRTPAEPPEDWQSQVHQELAVLKEGDPDAVADVDGVIQQVVELANRAAQKHGVRVDAQVAGSGLLVRVHPAMLRQVMIVAVQKMVQVMAGGQIEIAATHVADRIQLTLAGSPLPPHFMLQSEFIQAIVAAANGTLHTRLDAGRYLIEIELPSEAPVTVLVVDDNADLVHFFRRYTDRSRFRILHLEQGSAIFETLQQMRPQVIVLDVMLPDMDGWEILTRLHGDPETRAIPVIICSVVRQAELARDLGATLYLPKPVRRGELIQALEQALAMASASS